MLNSQVMLFNDNHHLPQTTNTLICTLYMNVLVVCVRGWGWVEWGVVTVNVYKKTSVKYKTIYSDEHGGK